MDRHIQTTFYKYIPADAALLVLQNKTLRYSKYNELNTPMESNFTVSDVHSQEVLFAQISEIIKSKIDSLTDDPEHRQDLYELYLDSLAEDARKMIRNVYSFIPDMLADHYGALCLTIKPDNELMWSHYAKGHTGVVLAFDALVPFFLSVIDVIYSDTRIDVEFEEKRNPDMSVVEKVQAVFGVKGTCWSYEEEVRLTEPIEWLTPTVIENKTIYVKPFPTSALKTVIYGSRISDTDRTAIESALSEKCYEHVGRAVAIVDRKQNKIVII